jgi:DNA-binding MarR family transcriptional regulator
MVAAGNYQGVPVEPGPTRRPAVLALADEIRHLTATRRDFSRQAGGAPCTLASLSVLGVVERQGPARVGEIATALGVDASVASRQVAQLTTDGLLDRVLDERDSRSHLVRVTALGAEALRGVRAALLGRWASALDGWSDAEVAALAGQLRRLRADLGAAGVLSGQAGRPDPSLPPTPAPEMETSPA